MTDTIEAAAEWAFELAETIVFGNLGPGNAAHEIKRAFAARIAAHTKALIEGAGDVERGLLRWASFGYGADASATMRQAAATIAALRAEVERAKLDGVRAGVEASALLLERDDGFGEWWDAAQFVRSELDAEATAKGIITADALSDLIAGDADLIVPDTLADSDGDDGA